MTYNKQKETTCCKVGYTVSKSARGTRVICKQCNQPTKLQVKLTEDDEDQPEPDLDPAAEILRYTEPLHLTVTNPPGGRPYSGKSFLAEIVWPDRNDSGYPKIQPLIKFYDVKYAGHAPEWEKGQPVCQYYAASIAGHPKGAGLSLYGSEPAWYLDPQACGQVVAWINAEMSKRGYKLTGDWLDHHYESQEDPDSPELFTNPERVTKQSKSAILEAAFRGMLKPYYDQIAVRATKVEYFEALAEYTVWKIECKRSGKQLPIPNRYQSLYTYKQAVDWRKQVEEWFNGIAVRHKMLLRDFRVYGRLRKDPTFTFDTYRWKSDAAATSESLDPDDPETVSRDIIGKLDWEKDLDQALWKFHPYGVGYSTVGGHSQGVVSVWTYFPVERRDEFSEQVKDFVVKWLTDQRIMPIKNVQVSKWQTGNPEEQLSAKTGFVVYINCPQLADAMQIDARRTSMLPPVEPA
jgi:hypothetical protein